MNKLELRLLIREELQKLNEASTDVFVLWSNRIVGNLPKAIQKAKYIGKSGIWNDEYKKNAANGHGTVFFVAADNVKHAKELIKKTTEKNSIGTNVYGKYGQTSENRVIKESKVARISNFNLESDAYIAMLDILSKNNIFKKIVIKHANDVFTGGKFQIKSVAKEFEKLIKPEFLKAVVDKINKSRSRIWLSDDQYTSPKVISQFAGVLAMGVLDSLVNDPLDYDLIKSLGDRELTKLADEFSANRGRSKMGAMIGNSPKFNK